MISLPNNCYCSELKVNPKNWRTLKKIANDWLIYYRFYGQDARHRELYPKGKLVRVQGMNHFKTLLDRRRATLQLLEDEVKKLQQGFNPIVGDIAAPVNINTVDPTTPFLQALEFFSSTISASPSTKRELKSILGFVSSAAAQPQFDNLNIGVISRKHLKLLLAQIEKTPSGESYHRYNKIRSYLMILF
ncbi:hypothetical protein [Segetibacter koreensis]|uniref:hypothetical protein n=1 Tax=Segetibacter koreensis TaxID=398037 RepID=UPI0003A41E41|nr:hypothetical protein [Segetibacter koreensis]